ncbi:energy transducer TonB, partial [cf. Phormidesmis sp. LEGE 11477]|uniref:energy transducer TonB n=1 Tax=cf. Phormidesmis sp. LEGE 11477 TaxID=1828680 RepID=UPI00187E3A09|nr:TonB family protein [cf. Phormidesmis sp. LEGE 11477]
MGFSKDTFEQYRREIRIMWRVLGVGALVAGGVHFFSLPFISRMISGAPTDDPQVTAVPVEIIVEEELVQQAPDEPEPEPPEPEPEPAASASRPSAAPLATNAEPVPTPEVAAADTVAAAPAIATENGEIDGEGAVGDSTAVGLVPGSGEPVTGDHINLPPPQAPPSRPRAPVEEISLAARRAPSSRVVSCNPCTLPDYPMTARREKVEGQPVINAIFDTNGRVISAEIEVSSGNAAFDQAALEEARRNWRFQDPMGLGGQISVDVVYVIDDSEQSEEAEQAGEIRAVELPVGQQVRDISPDQTAPPTTRSSATSQDASQDAIDQDIDSDTDSINTEDLETGDSDTQDQDPENLNTGTSDANDSETDTTHQSEVSNSLVEENLTEPATESGPSTPITPTTSTPTPDAPTPETETPAPASLLNLPGSPSTVPPETPAPSSP